MCFGVRDAIALARTQASTAPVTILGDLVHNETVIAELRGAGIAIETELHRVKTRHAIVTAHGTSQKSLQAARQHGLEVVEATCPLVHRAHDAVAELVRDGYYPVIVGKATHVEVRGITDDLAEVSVIESERELEKLPARQRYGVAAQTTQPVTRVRALVQAIQQRFPEAEVKFIDTVCQPTKQRQTAAEALARQCDIVIVIGGSNSNNTKELVRTCERHCPRVRHVQTPDDLREEWFRGLRRVGLTAGTSTPDATIDAIEDRLEQIAALQLDNLAGAAALCAS